ncbi:MAG: PAS domain S-box protein, partial [Deltaproteobacteria bacterium]|nr:PAS domain S-box protein [Deltaproteobacteria bacterium]
MSEDDLISGVKRPANPRRPGDGNAEKRTPEFLELNKALEAENAARRRAEAVSHLLLSLTQAILAAPDFEAALKSTLKSICEFTHWDYGEYWLPNAERSTLVMRDWWHKSTESLARLAASSSAMTLERGPNSGLPGRTWMSKRPEWIPDLKAEPGILRRRLFENAGLRSAFTVPIVSGEEVAAVLLFFMGEVRQADDLLMQIVGGAAAQLGFIFKHKQTQEELFKNEALLQSIIDSSTRVIYLKDKEGRYITINCQFESLFRIDERDAKGKKDFDIFPAEYAKVFRDNDLRVIEAGLPMEFEEVALLEDGPHTYLSNKFPMFDSAGGLYAICGISADITEQKRLQEIYQSARDALSDEVEKRTVKLVETNQALLLVNKQKETALEELQRSDRLLRTIIEAEPECVKIFGPDGLLTMMNPAGLKMIEADSAETIQGKFVYPLVVPEDRAAFQSLTERVFRGESGRLEFDIIGLKGTRRTLETHVVPLRDSSGNVISALGVTREITERKQAQESIRRSEEWLRALIDTTQDAVISIDRKGQVVLFNPSAERMFGYRRQEIVGQKVNLLMAEPYSVEHEGYIARYERTGDARAIGRIRTVQAKRKNGEVFPIELSVTEIPSDDEVHYAAFIRDISEKAKLQAKTIENERLA